MMTGREPLSQHLRLVGRAAYERLDATPPYILVAVCLFALGLLVDAVNYR